MTSSSDEGFEAGSPTALDRLASALEERNDQMGEIVLQLRDLTPEVRGLRQDVGRRPTRAETSHRRRTAVAGLLVFGMTTVLLTDQHVENCSPGARVEYVLEQLVSDPAPATAREFDALVRSFDPSPLCDLTSPFHSHNQPGAHPSAVALLGYGLYAGGVAALLLYATGPRAWRRRKGADDEQ